MHLFWLVLFVPAVILGQWIWPVLKQRSIWIVLVLIAGLSIAGWLAMGLPILESDQWTVSEIAKMFAFRLAAYTDFPLIQMLIASAVGWLRSKPAPSKASTPAEAESQLAAW